MESGSEYQNSEITMTVNSAGTDATISESFIGAKFQDKYKLSNELVNSIQTSISSIIAIL